MASTLCEHRRCGQVTDEADEGAVSNARGESAPLCGVLDNTQRPQATSRMTSFATLAPSPEDMATRSAAGPSGAAAESPSAAAIASGREATARAGAASADGAGKAAQTRRAVASSVIGCALDSYDFLIFIYLGHVIKRLFFPEADPITKNLAFYGTFAAGFLFRPLGAVVFGWVGDRFGRKLVLQMSVWAITVPTLLIACLPTYPQVGVLAPSLLVVLRVLQGFGKGGEVGGSIVFLVETAPPHQRGLYGSLAPVSVLLGILVGSFVSLLTLALLSKEQLDAWGWRMPFLLTLLGSALAIYIRKYVREPGAGRAPAASNEELALLGSSAHVSYSTVTPGLATASSSSSASAAALQRLGTEEDEEGGFGAAEDAPLTLGWGGNGPGGRGGSGGADASPCKALPSAPVAHPRLSSPAMGLITIMLVDFTDAYGFYLAITFLVNFFVDFVGLSPAQVLGVNTTNMLLYILAAPLGGWLSDKHGRVIVMMVPALLLALLGYPVWCLFKLRSAGWAWLGQALLVVTLAVFNGVRPAAMCEVFPVEQRCRGVSVGHSLSMALFGGTAGVAATALIGATGDMAAPALLLAAGGLLSAVGLVLMRCRGVH